jgi:hypothetical protein
MIPQPTQTAQFSCTRCRSIKKKCDRTFPCCARCIRTNHECSYIPPAKRGPKGSEPWYTPTNLHAPVVSTHEDADIDSAFKSFLVPNSIVYERTGRFAPVLEKETMERILNFLRTSNGPIPDEADLSYVYAMNGDYILYKIF